MNETRTPYDERNAPTLAERVARVREKAPSRAGIGFWPILRAGRGGITAPELTKVGFNAAYLADIGAAVAKLGASSTVRVSIQANGRGTPAGELLGAQGFDFETVDGVTARGLLMPMRLKETVREAIERKSA